MASSQTVEMDRIKSTSLSPMPSKSHDDTAPIVNKDNTTNQTVDHLGDDLEDDNMESIQHMITDELPFSEKSIAMKIFHIFLLSAAIAAPIVLISTFLWASYQ